MYSNIKVYQKYLVTSIKVGCAMRSLYASSGPKALGQHELLSFTYSIKSLLNLSYIYIILFST